jgi:hypothetical protein
VMKALVPVHAEIGAPPPYGAVAAA